MCVFLFFAYFKSTKSKPPRLLHLDERKFGWEEELIKAFDTAAQGPYATNRRLVSFAMSSLSTPFSLQYSIHFKFLNFETNQVEENYREF